MSPHPVPLHHEAGGAAASTVDLVDVSLLDDLRQRLLESVREETGGSRVVRLSSREVGAILLSYGILVRALRRVLSEDDPAARRQSEWILERIGGGSDRAG